MIDLYPQRRERLNRLEIKIRKLDRLHSRLMWRASESRRIASREADVPQTLRDRLRRRTERRERRTEECFQLSRALHELWCAVHAGEAV